MTVKEFLDLIKTLSNEGNIDDIILDFRVNIEMEPKNIEDCEVEIFPDKELHCLNDYDNSTKTVIINLYEN